MIISVTVICFLAGSTGEEGKEEDDADSIPADRKPVKSTLLSKINAVVIKSILELLCDESVSFY